MKIIFSCLGFTTSDAFVVAEGRQLKIGSIYSRFPKELEFWPDDFFINYYVKHMEYVKIEDVPTTEQILAEYKRQYAEKGVVINDKIVYAG